MPTISVVQILTASIAPVIVISGVGLLLLSIRWDEKVDPRSRIALSYRDPRTRWVQSQWIRRSTLEEE
jgi:hypothetical protein